MENTSTPGRPPNTSDLPGCFSYGLLIVAALWIVLASGLIHLIGWFVDQFAMIQGTPFALPVWPIISFIHGLVLGVPIVALMAFSEAPRFRAVYQTWALAVGLILPLSFVRALPPTWTQAASLVQIVICLLGSLAVVGIARWLKRSFGTRAAAMPLALAVAPIVAAPFLLWGAFGSLTDTALNLLAGLSLGLFAGLAFDAFLFRPLAEHPSGAARDLGRGGLAAGLALVILGTGFGFNGSQLLLLLALPPLGLALAGLYRLDQAWPALALTIGLATAAPLMLVDPDEMALILGDYEILQWAFAAAVLMLIFSWLVSIGLALAGGLVKRPPTWIMTLGGAVLTWFIGSAIYFGVGQPGFHGEQLFVILKDQADVRAAYQMQDRTERLTYVYTTLVEHADATQADLRRTLDLVRADYQPYYLVNALEVNGGILMRLYLSAQPEVDRVIDSPHLRPLPMPIPISEGETEVPPTEPQWNITSIGADRVWDELGVTGEGIIVGQSDSGVQGDHPALADGYRGRNGTDDYNWLDPWNHTASPTEIGGHGTHTLGSVLGRNGIGVAPGAEWFGCVNLARNLANPPLYLTCMQFMLAPWPQAGDPLTDGDPTRAAHVINNSWGCPPLEGCDALSLQPAVSALRAAGIFVVASAGNEGPRCGSVSDPIAIYDDAFSVGAVDWRGDLADFSSRGPVTVDGSDRPKPDIVAPGDGVLSAWPTDRYSYAGGTSMAGPHVVGAVALMWSANPSLIGDIDRTEEILRETARPYTGAVNCGSGAPNNSVGDGLLDAYAAVKRALEEK